MKPKQPASPPPLVSKHPRTHEPPAEEERPSDEITGEQPRSRSSEGDPENPPD